MNSVRFPVVNLIKTGKRISTLMKQSKLTVRDVQDYLGLESPQAIYKWRWGKCMPTIDNLIALARLFNTTIENIIVVDEICM